MGTQNSSLRLVFAFSIGAALLGTVSSRAEEPKLISTKQHIVGGILGTTLGLGVGHGIQGRYSQDGVLSTVGETASLAVAVAGIATCTDHDVGGGKCGGSLAVFAIGAAGFVGFRIWEAIDAWARPFEINRRAREGNAFIPFASPEFFAAHPGKVASVAPRLGFVVRF